MSTPGFCVTVRDRGGVALRDCCRKLKAVHITSSGVFSVMHRHQPVTGFCIGSYIKMPTPGMPTRICVAECYRMDCWRGTIGGNLRGKKKKRGDLWPLEKGGMHRIFYTDPSGRRYATGATPRESITLVPERCYMTYRKIWMFTKAIIEQEWKCNISRQTKYQCIIITPVYVSPSRNNTLPPNQK